MLAAFGFDLNNREIAFLVYVFLFLLWVVLWREGRPLAYNLLQALFAPKLLAVWLLMSFYIIACVWLLAWIGVWHWFNLKSTLLWWVTIGFTCLTQAIRLKNHTVSLKRLVFEVFELSAVVTFIAEFNSFSLLIELILFPLLFLLCGLIAVGQNKNDKPNMNKVIILLNTIFSIILIIILSYSLLNIIVNSVDFFSLKTLSEFGIPLILWVMFIPFIFLLSVWIAYEDGFLQLQMRPKQNGLVSYARWKSLLAFGWNIDGVKRLIRDIRMRDIMDKSGVDEAIKEIKVLLKIEKKPPIISLSDGWSAYKARLFLEEYGIIADDYHRTSLGWSSNISAVKIDKRHNFTFSYYLTGTDRAVTELRLELNSSDQNNKVLAQTAFDQRATSLIDKSLGAEIRVNIFAELNNSKNKNVVLNNGISISLDEEVWGTKKYGGYTRILSIRHPSHHFLALALA